MRNPPVGARAAAEQQDAPPPEPVGQRAEHQQQRCEDERVGLLYPLHAGGVDAQVVDDGRDRDVDDRRVDDDERHGDADEDQPGPAAAVRDHIPSLR
jgi:hypothetical protein